MKKIFFITSMLFALVQVAGAQAAQGQPASASRDVATSPAEIQPADTTGTASSSAKDETGPANAADARLPASPGTGKADDRKQPKR